MIRASIPWNCKQIHKMVVNNSLIFDNVIQRGFVWGKKKSSLFIDSILRDYAVPAIYTIKSDKTVKTPKGTVNVFDCLDGKQRCLTIAKFKNNELPLTGVKPIILDDGTTLELEGMTYEQLPEQLKDDFDKYSMTVCYITDITTDEIIEFMSRLNNGKPLTNTEIARIKAPDLKSIDDLADCQMFKQLYSEKAINGYQDEDTVIKTYMVLQMIHGKHKYTSLDNTDVRPVFESMILTDEDKSEILAIYDMILDVYNKLVDNKKKKAANTIARRTHLLSIVPVIDLAKQNGYDTDTLADWCAEFFDGKPSISHAYNDACKSGSNHAENVHLRLDETEKFFKAYLSNHPIATTAVKE